MLVEIAVCEKKEIENEQGEIDYKNIILYKDVENWDLYETVSEVYKGAQAEYGRCASKIYIDKMGGGVQHIGWVFEKRQKYQDCNKTYLQETWIVPLKKRKVKVVKEYMLGT